MKKEKVCFDKKIGFIVMGFIFIGGLLLALQYISGKSVSLSSRAGSTMNCTEYYNGNSQPGHKLADCPAIYGCVILPHTNKCQYVKNTNGNPGCMEGLDCNIDYNLNLPGREGWGGSPGYNWGKANFNACVGYTADNNKPGVVQCCPEVNGIVYLRYKPVEPGACFAPCKSYEISEERRYDFKAHNNTYPEDAGNYCVVVPAHDPLNPNNPDEWQRVLYKRW